MCYDISAAETAFLSFQGHFISTWCETYCYLVFLQTKT